MSSVFKFLSTIDGLLNSHEFSHKIIKIFIGPKSLYSIKTFWRNLQTNLEKTGMKLRRAPDKAEYQDS